MRSVKLGDRTYTVRVVPDPVEHCREVDAKDEIVTSGEPLAGYIDRKRREIVLKLDTSKAMSTTLLHELLHEAFPYLTEEVVADAEERLFPVLWRHGFRPF